MGTTAAPIAAAAPAVATPTPAPQSTPTPPTPPPSQPSSQPSSGEPTPVSTPTPEAASATPAVPAGPPDQSTYENSADGMEQYLNDRHAWNEAHPEAAEQQPAELPDVAPDPNAPTESTQEVAPQESVPPTPQALDEWTGKDPAFKAALDANPELKGQLMAMAQQNERAKPVLDLVGSIEEAQFAVENANAFVDLRNGLMLSVEDPTHLPQTFDKLQDLFRVKDAAGNYVKDAAGNYQMAEDYSLLRQQFVGDGVKATIQPLRTQAEALRARIERGVYGSDAEKQADADALQNAEYAVAALEYAEDLMTKPQDGPQLPDLPPDATPAQRKLQEELKKQLDTLSQAKAGAGKEQRQAQRTEYTTALNKEWGGGVGKMMDTLVAEERKLGGFIPDFVLHDKYVDPATGKPTTVSNFAMTIMTQFDQKIQSLPKVKQALADMYMRPPSPESLAAAKAYYDKVRADYLPKIIKAEIKRIQDGILQSQTQRDQQRGEQGRVATVEPRSGSTPMPRPMTDEQIRQTALENVRKRPDYADASGGERLEMELNERHRLRS